MEKSHLMRILFVNKASPRLEGGAEIRSREIGKRLVLQGHEVVVITAKTHPDELPMEILDGMKVYHKKILPDWLVKRYPFPHYLPQAAANLFLMFHLYFFLKRERFDLIREDVSPFPPSFLLAFFRLKTRRMAIVHNLAGNLMAWVRNYGFIYGLAGFAMDRLLRGGHLKYDKIVCAARWLAEELKRSPRIAGKVSYVPNGIDLGQFVGAYCDTPAGATGRSPLRITGAINRAPTDAEIDPVGAGFKPAPSRAGLEPAPTVRAYRNTPVLLSVGRFAEIKGHRYLIEALSFLKGDFPEITLTLLGAGDLKESLISLANRLGVGEQLEIRAPVPYEQMPLVYRQFDFLVLPSLSEGFPMVILEAMAAGLPIVATDIPGVREILDPGLATLCTVKNARDLADKLKWALEHPEEIAQKAEAAQEAVKTYDWEMMARQELEGACED